MLLSSDPALQKVIELVTQANKLLSEAESIFYGELVATLNDNEFSDAIRFEAVLEGATHETASSLGLYLHDIKTLLSRLEMRERYPQLTNAQFEEIVNQEWSLALVKKMQEQLQSGEKLKLAEISAFIKGIQSQWLMLSFPK